MSFKKDTTLYRVRDAITDHPRVSDKARCVEQYLTQLRTSSIVDEATEASATSRAQKELHRLFVLKTLFELCWEQLSDEEQMIISSFHWEGRTKSEARYALCDKLHCSVSTIDRKYIKALKRLKEYLDWSNEYAFDKETPD